MQYLSIFWPLFCTAFAWMQGRLLPAIRRTAPGQEAQEQANALHVVGTLAYFLPTALVLALTPGLALASLLVALAARVALFDPVINTAARRPAFEVGQTAATDRFLRRLSPANPERLSAILRLLASALLAGGAVALSLNAI